jgi:hypothetical protein
MSALDGQLIDESTGGINAPSGIQDAHKLARANAEGDNLEYVDAATLIVGDGSLAEALAPLLAGAGLTDTGPQLTVGAGAGITVLADSVAVTIPLTDGDKGDITVGALGTTFTIDAGAVTPAKQAALAANSFLANPTGALATLVAHPFATLAGVGLLYAAGAIDIETPLTDGDKGDITVSGNGATFTINPASVATGDLANVLANTFLANPTASGAPLISHPFATLAGGGLAYAAGVIAVGAGTGLTVNANDVEVTTPLTDGDKGDITVGANGTTFTIDSGVVTVTKMASAAADSFLANPTGAPAALVAHPFSTLAGAGLAYAAGALAVTGSTSISITSDQVQRAALTGAIVAAANTNATTFGTIAANTALANGTGGTAAPTALAAAADGVLQRVGSAVLGFSTRRTGLANDTTFQSITAAVTNIIPCGNYIIPAGTAAVGDRYEWQAALRFVRGATATAMTLQYFIDSLAMTTTPGTEWPSPTAAGTYAVFIRGSVTITGLGTVAGGGRARTELTAYGPGVGLLVTTTQFIDDTLDTTVAISISPIIRMQFAIASCVLSAFGGDVQRVR